MCVCEFGCGCVRISELVFHRIDFFLNVWLICIDTVFDEYAYGRVFVCVCMRIFVCVCVCVCLCMCVLVCVHSLGRATRCAALYLSVAVSIRAGR